MKKEKLKIIQRERRHKRVRGKIFGKKERPRLSVFRSNKYIYAQLIDDEEGKTLVSASDREIKSRKKLAKVEKAKNVAELLIKKALEKNIKEIVFDRGSYKYHGRIKALAEAARKGGLKF